MSQSEPTAPGRQPPLATAYQPPREFAEILVPSIQVGLGAGTVGLLVGAASGIVRSAPPVLFSLVTGAQWFALSSSYYGARQAVIAAWGGDAKITPTDKVKASALAGASAGLVGGALRGPRNILPAMAVFSLVGAGGQAALNALPDTTPADGEKKTSWMDSKWSPFTSLTDDEYARFIEDKVLKLDVEISMIDDKLAALRASKAQKKAEAASRPDA